MRNKKVRSRTKPPVQDSPFSLPCLRAAVLMHFSPQRRLLRVTAAWTAASWSSTWGSQGDGRDLGGIEEQHFKEQGMLSLVMQISQRGNLSSPHSTAEYQGTKIDI